jgi:hypothetical protein
VQTGYLLDGENDATLGKHPVWRAGITGSSQVWVNCLPLPLHPQVS